EARHMRMTGYPSKVKSLSWSVKGNWLASSGAPAAIVWPFQGKDGPMARISSSGWNFTAVDMILARVPSSSGALPIG
ncbi:hypothetical protein ACC702_40105, partial [Rhizobium ruizarguesonis]